MKPFTEIDVSQWPDVPRGGVAVRVKVFRNDTFLVQVFSESNVYRMTVNVIKQRYGVWVDGITWDQLQEIKGLIGFGDTCAVEIYPPDQHVVHVAKMRHLWLLNAPPPFMWKNPW